MMTPALNAAHARMQRAFAAMSNGLDFSANLMRWRAAQDDYVANLEKELGNEQREESK